MAARRLLNLAVLLVVIVYPLVAHTPATPSAQGSSAWRRSPSTEASSRTRTFRTTRAAGAINANAANAPFHQLRRRPGPLAYAIGFDGETSITYFGVLGIGSGIFQPITELPLSAQGLGRDRRGHLFIVDTANNLVHVNPVSGTTKVIGATGVTTPGPLGNTLVDVFASLLTGELFLMDYDNNLYSVNPTTGAATLVGSTGIPRITSFRYSSSFAGSCQSLYFTITEVDENLNHLQGPSLYRIDPQTAAATLVGPTAEFMPGAGFVDRTLYGFSLDTRFLGGDPPRAFSIDVATGEATPVSVLDVTGIFGAVDLAHEAGKRCRRG